MKITKAKLKQIIKEEFMREYEEGSAPPELVKQWVVEFEDFIASQYAGGKGKPISDLPQDEFPAVVAALEQLITKLGDISSKQEFRQ